MRARRPAALMEYSQIEYETARALQRRLVETRAAGYCPDTLLLLEHDPVYTVGRRGQPAHWHGEAVPSHIGGHPVVWVERGGSITYHGPGQLVGYPILRLQDYCPGPKAYVWRLEETVIRTLEEWGIIGRRREGLPGVWVGDSQPAKIAAVGVRIVRGITMHGFALNVTVDLEPFGHIVPCGIPGVSVTSMAALLGHSVDMAAVRARLASRFAEVFGLAWTEVTFLDAMETDAQPVA
ncbi:lipoyl(octanoyl) transferase LipB [Nitrospira sp. Kam-Ns4a]